MADDDQTLFRKPASVQQGEAHPCFILLSGSAAGNIFRLQRNKYVIGRSADSDLCLDDDGVSRQHAKVLVIAPGVVTLKDLDSRNGTFVNGEKVKSRVLEDGDRVQIGSTTILKFSIQDALEDAFQQQLYSAATRDPLTQIYNKRFFEEQLGKDFTYARRQKASLSLLIADLDHFKVINDTRGHLAGDAVLRQVTALLTRSIRNEDVLCRIGGEELAVIARGSDLQGACVLAERLRQSIEQHAFGHENIPIAMTASFGISRLDPTRHTSPVELVDEADRLLYQAKAAGRNCVRPLPSIL